MSKIIGIDLGTTNSMAAFTFEHGAQVLENADLSSWQVSAVYSEGDKILVGKDALQYRVLDAANCFFSFKPLMGKKYQEFAKQKNVFSYPIFAGTRGEILLGSKKFLPEQLSAEILKKIKSVSEIILQTNITQAVITVPAYFDEVQRQATKQAAILAGLEVVRMINEPTAAAIAYGIDQKKQGKVAVFDFGGGTFDISILEFKHKIFRVLATQGNAKLGGDDLDQLLVNYIINEYLDGLEPTANIKNYLRQIAQDAKIFLNNHLEYHKKIKLSNSIIDFQITRQVFNEIIAVLVAKTLQHTALALKDAALSVSQIDDVVLVGGSTKVALVREKVIEFFGKTPHLRIDPDRVVAVGAAIQAHLLAGNSRDFLLIDVIPLSLGIETLDGIFTKLILKNSSIPCQRKEIFSTQKDNQTSININIYQGERELIKDCRFLGKFVLRGLPPMVAGLPRIEVEFLVDANGLLRVSAKETRSGLDARIDVIPDQGLSQEQVEQMIETSIVYAQADFSQRYLQEVRFQARIILNLLQKSWKQAEKFYSKKELAVVIARKEFLQKTTKAEDPLAIKNAVRELDKLTTEFANYLVESSLQNTNQGS